MTQQLEDVANTISVVIPVLNEIQALPANLATLLQAPSVDQVIVVDGGSTDGTIAHVQALDDPRILLVHSAPGRGRQMNAGARLATGEWLIFHHADSSLSITAISALDRLSSDICWGGFTHRFAPPSLSLRFISWLHNLRCRCSGAVYGDQSMFVRRRFFWRVGGFAETLLEDLIFSDQALRLSPSRLLPETVTTDSRKFQQIGTWRALWQVAAIVIRYQREQQIGHEAFFKPYR